METTTHSEPNKSAENFFGQLQPLIVAMLIYDPDAWPDIGKSLKPEHFENRVLSDSVRLIQDFYERYQRPPIDEEFLQEVCNLLGTSRGPLPVEVYYKHVGEMLVKGIKTDLRYVRDQVFKFVKFQAYKDAIINSADTLQISQDYDAIDAKMNEARSIGGPTHELDVLDLEHVERKEIEWFWHNKIPRAKLSLIVGDPATGKSWFTMFLAAAVTTGDPLPHSAHRTEQGRVVILSAEDDPEDTIVPRLEDCGGNKALVHVIRGKRQGKMFNLAEDLARLGAYIEAKGNVKLIIIDPISAYLGAGGKINTHKDTDVRGILSPVAKLAKDFDVTIIGVMHLNKSQDLGAMYRVSGSMAFVAQARAVWLMTKENREGEDRLLHYFTPLKTNLSPTAEGLCWRINDERGGLEFLEPSFQPPPIEEQLGPKAPKRPPSKLDEAKEFLRERLKDGEPVDSAEIFEEAAEVGIANATLSRAKRELKVESRKKPGIDSTWTWVLPLAAS